MDNTDCRDAPDSRPNGKPQLLIIAPYVPGPNAGGAGINYVQMITRLARHFEIDLVCQDRPSHTDADVARLRPFCHDITVLRLDRRHAYLNCATALLTHGSLRVAYVREPELRRLVRRKTTENDYVCALAVTERMAQYLSVARAPVRIVDLIDFVSFRHKQALALRSSPARRLVDLYEFFALRRFERHLVEQSDQVWLSTEGELSKLRHVTGRGDVRVLLRGLDFAEFRGPRANVDPNMVLYVADYGYWPNQDAARWLIESIWPQVVKARPSTRIWFVGARAPDWLKNLPTQDPTITVTGKVPSVIPYLKRATVFVCPLRFGGGVRYKLLEAMAASCPAVSTRLGHWGLRIEPGKHLVEVDRAPDFARAIVRLLENPTEGATMAERAFQFVEDNYDSTVAARIAAGWIEEGTRANSGPSRTDRHGLGSR